MKHEGTKIFVYCSQTREVVDDFTWCLCVIAYPQNEVFSHWYLHSLVKDFLQNQEREMLEFLKDFYIFVRVETSNSINTSIFWKVEDLFWFGF